MRTKQDQKKVSMQKHEIEYTTKLAKRFLTQIDELPANLRGVYKFKYLLNSMISPKQIARICKHYIKLAAKV